MSNIITAISINVGAGAIVDFRPPTKEAWEIMFVGSNNLFIADVPDIEVSMKKGGLSAILLIDPSTDPGNRGRTHKWLTTNTVYLSLKNTGAAGAEISIIGNKINPFNVLSDVVSIGAGATINIDPGLAYNMVIFEMGYSVFTLAPLDINPNISVKYDDNILSTAIIWDPAQIFGHDKRLTIPVSHAIQLAVTDSGGAGGVFCYSAEKARNVVYQYENVLAGADMDVVPPAGQEWAITCIATSILAGLGGPPMRYPDANVMIRVVANESNLMEAGSISASILWDNPYNILIDHANNLRLHNANALAMDICVSGFLLRSY